MWQLCCTGWQALLMSFEVQDVRDNAQLAASGEPQLLRAV
jgi:hypothetical protein